MTGTKPHVVPLSPPSPVQGHAWIIMPSNRGAYGFDWQGPGRVNGWSALAAFQRDLPGVPASLKGDYALDATRVRFGVSLVLVVGCTYSFRGA